MPMQRDTREALHDSPPSGIAGKRAGDNTLSRTAHHRIDGESIKHPSGNTLCMGQSGVSMQIRCDDPQEMLREHQSMIVPAPVHV